MKTQIAANWSHAILICRKCGKKKQNRCFGPEGKPLAKALRDELDVKKGRKAGVGIVEVGCLDICPKRGVVVVDSRTPGQWRIVTCEADLGQLARDLVG